MINTRELTEDNLEKNFATNTLGKVFFESLKLAKSQRRVPCSMF